MRTTIPAQTQEPTQLPHFNAAERKPRLTSIEALRAYLAIWVVVCHALWASGFEFDTLVGPLKILRRGDLAVDVFIIISGFVIFFLLDKREETSAQFIVRRFFRLFPLFVVLFFVAIPISKLTLGNLAHATQYLSPQQAAFVASRVHSWWQNIYYHIPIHLLMLQGIVPGRILPDSPGAFLDPAWSISLEWQFYLVAPIAYSLCVSSFPIRRIAILVGCVFISVARNKLFPSIAYGAALPFHLHYFYLGAASYFFYKQRGGFSRSGAWLPFAIGLGVVIFIGRHQPILLIPAGIWLVFMTLILDDSKLFVSGLVGPFFNHRFIRYLGKTSYSIYLSHILVIVLVQYLLLKWMPQLSQRQHFAVLLMSTLVVTIILSDLLYRLLEDPGIKAGRWFAARLSPQRLPVLSAQQCPNLSE